jgi:ATP adenylyltransferase
MVGHMADPNTPPSSTPTTLFAPWRMQYLETMDATEKKAAASGGTGSFLRDYWLTPDRDEANHVIVRTADGMILLNGFPYANGHLLVALGEARPSLLDYTEAQRAMLWRLVDVAAELVQSAMNPQGINIGINQGRAAGAGIPQHLHAHLVPRWSGDVNFISVVGGIRVIPASLEAMAKRYRQSWEGLRGRYGV